MSSALAMVEHTAPVLAVSMARQGVVYYGGCCKGAWQWDLGSEQKTQVAAHDLPISCLAYVEDNVPCPMLITGGWDGKVNFWDLRSNQPAQTEDFGAPIMALDASTPPMATFLQGRHISVFNLATMTRCGEYDPNPYMKYGFRSVANLSNQVGFVVAGCDGRFAWHPLGQGAGTLEGYCQKCHHVERTKTQFDLFQVNTISCAGGTCATGGSDGFIRLWSIVGKVRIMEFPPRQGGTVIPVSAGAFNAEGTMYAYALSYDYSLGRPVNASTPRSICVKMMQPDWIKPL